MRRSRRQPGRAAGIVGVDVGRDVYEVDVRLGDHRRRVVLRLGQAGERQVIAQAVEAILRLDVQRVPAIAGAERDVEPGPAAVA